MNTKNTISENGVIVRSGATTITGVLFLLGAIAGSLVLAGTKLGLYSHAPGCGVDSGCNAKANGVWGSIPGLGWPGRCCGMQRARGRDSDGEGWRVGGWAERW